jgi:hypothetical protein
LVTHPLDLVRDFDEPEREMLTQNVSHLSFDCNLFADIPQMPFSVARVSFCEIHAPHGEIRVSSPVEQRPAYVAAKNAAVMRPRLVLRECHFSLATGRRLLAARAGPA